MKIDTLLSARWILPVEPQGVVLEQHAIAIHNGRIEAVLPREEAEQRYQADHVQHFEQHVLMPGLINMHGHAAMTLMRGLADDLPLMEWLQEHIWPAEQQWVGKEFVYDGTLHACAEMLRGGTTCFNDMYFFPEETVRAVEQAGMRACIGLIMIDFPTPWAQTPDEYLSKGIALHDQLRGNTLIRTAFAPHAPYTVSDEPLQRIATYAEELDIPVHMHVHETAHEVEESLNNTGKRPLQRLEELGLLNPHLLAVHMTRLNQEEIPHLAEAGVHVVHCPESNLKLASGFCPVQELARAGVNLCLGTDGAASNNDLDMFSEMRSAALLGKAVAGDASALPAEDVLRMATINGARALGLEQEIGSLEAGKSADIIAVDLGTLESQPVYHPASQLVYTAGREQVTDVWVAGRQLLKERELTTIDPNAVLERAQQWQQRLIPLN
ncbi:MAG: TRZ/ATZ family hydrolase [Thiohalophilus sp.]|uniref:TRZ/ATZ family hydrolase n=1 Tax=Thiohalophilus sp. TaxID=3028392 RepID=UPI0028705F39|nr:TRZ/ATZ family hydrolase [Thiohalophilus sp.]MDR9437419.1 TRZ/ATZ family hydrolase [Thiohalophilus sp.]